MIRTRACAAVALAGIVAGAGLAQDLPERPEQISFEELLFDPPAGEQYRHVLSNGVPVYLIESHEWPLINVTLRFKGGAHLVPEDMTGLAGMTGAMIRRGGTTTIPAEELDERFDYLAANASSTTLNCLASNFDEAFGLFMDMVRNPGFQEDKVRVYKDELLENMKQRNDNVQTIQLQTRDRILWGDDHYEARIPTQASIEAIDTDDLREYHGFVYQPGNLIIGVVGDFEPSEMISKLEAAMAGWEKGDVVPDPGDTSHEFTPGLYYVEKDVPQGRISIIQRGVTRDDPDSVPLEVMNEILGAGGFTSRMMKRIRSDEGLTYGVNSQLSNRVYYRGAFFAQSFSKNRTVALTTKMMLEEIAKMRDEQVTEEELRVAKNALIETFPRLFENKLSVVNLFISDEWTDRPADHWETYRQRVEAVTQENVQEVAREHLDPDEMAILIVGNWSEIAPGDPTEQREDYKVSMEEFGDAEQLPLLDPLTLEPIDSGDRPD